MQGLNQVSDAAREAAEIRLPQVELDCVKRRFYKARFEARLCQVPQGVKNQLLGRLDVSGVYALQPDRKISFAAVAVDIAAGDILAQAAIGEALAQRRSRRAGQHVRQDLQRQCGLRVTQFA